MICKTISNALEAINSNVETRLELRGSHRGVHMQDSDVTEQISRALKTNTKLTQIDFQNNQIGVGIEKIAEMLSTHSADSSNYLGDASAAYLADALKLNDTLTTLNLRSCQIFKTEVFVEALSQNDIITTIEVSRSSSALNAALERNKQKILDIFVSPIYTLPGVLFLQNCDKQILAEKVNGGNSKTQEAIIETIILKSVKASKLQM
eukprot:Awhi_evm1s15771